MKTYVCLTCGDWGNNPLPIDEPEDDYNFKDRLVCEYIIITGRHPSEEI